MCLSISASSFVTLLLYFFGKDWFKELFFFSAGGGEYLKARSCSQLDRCFSKYARVP